MITSIAHIGLTVSDLERSAAFYREHLGLTYVGALSMDGPETERLFGTRGCRARVGYLRSDDPAAPLVELIQFLDAPPKQGRPDLRTTSISELCFAVADIDAEYARLKAEGVEFLSEPQTFDSRADGFGVSRAVYLRDPDGNILELLQTLKQK